MMAGKKDCSGSHPTTMFSWEEVVAIRFLPLACPNDEGMRPRNPSVPRIYGSANFMLLSSLRPPKDRREEGWLVSRPTPGP